MIPTSGHDIDSFALINKSKKKYIAYHIRRWSMTVVLN